ncbi:S-layer homology domain-containing protein [Natronincola peptidivorans]|uniref:S-layer homology domain-containing protein n=1 Tax=Natronincola peptidivorans TaxID=426128 RepID=A0A1I0DYG4_9FIRM|nr:S-layer homology domain-containing protein [Natronincola peptidivorans]SET37782.1 S-layer homology domain-containing protein [Natronincola peptidivorans]
MKQNFRLERGEKMKMKLRRLAILLMCLVMIIPSFTFGQPSAGTDIENHWGQKHIEEWLNKGLISGYPDGSFRPDYTITRAEFFTLVNKAFHLNDTLEIRFNDVNETDWFYSQIGKALKAGYISGYPDNTIQPNNSISRQEAAIVLTKLLKLDTSLEDDSINIFQDSSKIARWSKGPVSAVIRYGLMKGYPDGSFHPERPITRAEAVIVLNKSLQLLELIEIEERVEDVELKDEIDYDSTRSSSGSSRRNDTYPPSAKNLDAFKLAVNEDILLLPKDLATYGEKVIAATMENTSIASGEILQENGLKIMGKEVGETTITATVSNSYGQVNITFTIVVIDSSQVPTDAKIVEEIKKDLDLSVENPTGRSKTSKIALPITDTKGYETIITWKLKDQAQDNKYILIEDNKAIIYRRGISGTGHDNGGCTVDDLSILSFMNIGEIGIYCGGDIGQEECSDTGGKTRIVALTAAIKKGTSEAVKDFHVMIPWGWGRAITIGEETSEDHSHNETTPIPRDFPDQILYLGQYPLFLMAEDLASYATTVTQAVYEPVSTTVSEAVYGEQQNTGSVSLKLLDDGRLKVTPVQKGKVNVRTEVKNEAGKIDIDFGITIEAPETVDAPLAVSEASNHLKLFLYSRGHGPDQINKVTLPSTDMLGYGTTITWVSSNGDFVTVQDEEAIIHRRGMVPAGEGCGGDAHTHIASLMAMDVITLNCIDGDHSHEDGSCGAGSDPGGRLSIVELTAIIQRNSIEKVNQFDFTIPWGWGREIILRKK